MKDNKIFLSNDYSYHVGLSRMLRVMKLKTEIDNTLAEGFTLISHYYGETLVARMTIDNQTNKIAYYI